MNIIITLLGILIIFNLGKVILKWIFWIAVIAILVYLFSGQNLLEFLL